MQAFYEDLYEDPSTPGSVISSCTLIVGVWDAQLLSDFILKSSFPINQIDHKD